MASYPENHPYYEDKISLLVKNFKEDNKFISFILSTFCFPELSPIQCEEIFLNMSWNNMKKMSCFYSPVIETKENYNSISLFHLAIKNGNANAENFLPLQMTTDETFVTLFISFFYGKQNVYNNLMKSYSRSFKNDIPLLLFDLISFSSLDIFMFIQQRKNIEFNDLSYDLQNYYLKILLYSDERIAEFLRIKINKNVLYSDLDDDYMILRAEHNIITRIPLEILRKHYNNMTQKAKNILGCYIPIHFKVLDKSSYFTSESYSLAYLNFATNFSKESEDLPSNDIGLKGKFINFFES